MRKREFEQLELELLIPSKIIPLVESQYLTRFRDFLQELGLPEPDIVRPLNLPHYSKSTQDFHLNYKGKSWQIGAISRRGTHDLSCYDYKNRGQQILEISIGLDRLICILFALNN